MATQRWGLHFEAGQKDDGIWIISRIDPSRKAIEQNVVAAWVTIKPDAIDVELELLDTPPIPPPQTNADGSVTTHPPWRLESARGLVSDLVLYDFLYPKLNGKSFATLTFHDKKTGTVFKQFKNRKY